MAENDHVFILWEFVVIADWTIPADRVNIIVKGQEMFAIDMTVPADKNVSTKQFDKLSKYKDFGAYREGCFKVQWHNSRKSKLTRNQK